MLKHKIILGSIFLFLAQQSFANTMSMPGTDNDNSKPCKKVAEACVKAGYAKKGEKGRFWFDCMKPIIMNKSVKGVTVDPKDVQACRQHKIEKLQKDLEDLQSVK